MSRKESSQNGHRHDGRHGADPSQSRPRPKRIGRLRRVSDIAKTFRQLSESDEGAADVLAANGFYRQAACLLLQAMEKSVRHGVYSQFLATSSEPDDVCSNRLRTHNLDDLLSVLLDVFREVIRDARVSQQIDEQLERYVVQGVRFHHLHNDVRYPREHRPSARYTVLEIDQRDVNRLKQTLKRLRSFIEGFHILQDSAGEWSSLKQDPSPSPAATPDENTSASVWTFRF